MGVCSSTADINGPRKIGPPTGPELFAAIAAEPSHWGLDEVLRRSPRAEPLTDAGLDALVKELRAERTAIEVKQEKAKAAKQGAIDESENDCS